MKLMHKGERGFSLIELVIVIGLTGVVAAGITGAILGVFNTDARTRDSMTAVYQVRHAGKLVSEDVLEAQIVSIDTVSVTGFPVTLTWTEVGGGPTHEVVYTLKDTSGEFKTLWREYYVDPDTNPTPLSSTKVAEYIDPEHTSCSPPGVLPSGDSLTFAVTATVGGQTETRVYQVKPRPGS